MWCGVFFNAMPESRQQITFCYSTFLFFCSSIPFFQSSLFFFSLHPMIAAAQIQVSHTAGLSSPPLPTTTRAVGRLFFLLVAIRLHPFPPSSTRVDFAPTHGRRSAWKDLRNRALGMNFLVAAGTSAAYLYSVVLVLLAVSTSEVRDISFGKFR